jgi:hypothetical protein
VSHIRVFGCDAYMHVKDTDRSKLEPKSIKCSLLGYSEYNQGYRLLDIAGKKIYYSRDVVFNEKAFHFKSTNSKAMVPSNQIESEEAQESIDERNTDNNSTSQEIGVGVSDAYVLNQDLLDSFPVPSNVNPNSNSVHVQGSSDNKQEEEEPQVDIEQGQDSDSESYAEAQTSETDNTVANDVEEKKEVEPQRSTSMSHEVSKLLAGSQYEMFQGPRHSKHATTSWFP